ncbi:MAG: VTT domain-containing protein, partial [Balneolaceae bacterium]
IHDYSESGKSLILLSGMGVQELHFLGNHTLNTILFSILKPLTWIFEYLIPHFGWYYSQPIDQEFASNLAQIDIREHRELMREIEIPVKIIHAADDRYIPVQAAREHFRIIPQSELSLVAGFHNSIFENPGEWFSEINTFIDHVDLDNGITKHDASLKRINESEQPFDRTRITPFTGWVYFIILCLIGLTTIINEDIACIGAGLLAARGLIGFWDALMACLIGIFIFDVMIYWIGRTLGSKAIRKAPFKWFIKEEDIKKAETMFELRGMEILFAAKFIPGTRFPTYFSAGLLKSNFLLFLLYFMVSVIIWAPIVIGISLFAGQTLLTFFQTYQDYFAIIAVGGGIIIYLIVKFLLPVFTVKGRRKLVEKWRRKR